MNKNDESQDREVKPGEAHAGQQPTGAQPDASDRTHPDWPSRYTADRSRRKFIRGVLGLGLANVSLSFFGAIPAHAAGMGSGGDGGGNKGGDKGCGTPEGDYGYAKDEDCHAPFGPDLDCAKPTVEGGFHSDGSCVLWVGSGSDISCNLQQPNGYPIQDGDCGMLQADGNHYKDGSCAAPSGEGVFNDHDCGKQSAEEPYHGDVACMGPANTDGNFWQDDTCGMPTSGGYIFDSGCGKPAVPPLGGNAMGVYHDGMCGKPDTKGVVNADATCNVQHEYSDDDCGILSGGAHFTDDDCAKLFLPVLDSVYKDDNCGNPDGDGINSHDSSCELPSNENSPPDRHKDSNS